MSKCLKSGCFKDAAPGKAYCHKHLQSKRTKSLLFFLLFPMYLSAQSLQLSNFTVAEYNEEYYEIVHIPHIQFNLTTDSGVDLVLARDTYWHLGVEAPVGPLFGGINLVADKKFGMEGNIGYAIPITKELYIPTSFVWGFLYRDYYGFKIGIKYKI